MNQDHNLSNAGFSTQASRKAAESQNRYGSNSAAQELLQLEMMGSRDLGFSAGNQMIKLCAAHFV